MKNLIGLITSITLIISLTSCINKAKESEIKEKIKINNAKIDSLKKLQNELLLSDTTDNLNIKD